MCEGPLVIKELKESFHPIVHKNGISCINVTFRKKENICKCVFFIIRASLQCVGIRKKQAN